MKLQREAHHYPGPPSTALVVDLLGDLRRIDLTALRLKSLVALGSDLGIAEPTMRMTLARLRTKGWFEVDRSGRQSTYRLTPLALSSLASGAQRMFRPTESPWSGNWSMVIYTVAESDRGTREELRKRLAWYGFGPLAPATWISPHPRLEEVIANTADLSAARLTMLTTRTSALAHDRDLAARAWDLKDLASDYRDFVRHLRLRTTELPADGLPAAAKFAERIELVYQFRQLARRDPQFPEELQPPGWPGDEASRSFRARHDMLAADAEQHILERVSASGSE